MTTTTDGTRATNRPPVQDPDAEEDSADFGQRPDPSADADAMRQVAVWSETGAILTPGAARTIAAWWHSPAGGAITSLSHSGVTTHWLAYECEREARATIERNQAELAALAAYGRFHAGYAYEEVIFLDGDDFDQAMVEADTHESSWVDGMFAHLMQWEYGDGTERHSTPPWGSSDIEYQQDGYLLAVNHGLGYASLYRIITEPED